MVSAGGSNFRAFFNISGNAEEKATNIERNVRNLNQTAIQSISNLEKLGATLGTAGDRAVTRSQKVAERSAATGAAVRETSRTTGEAATQTTILAKELGNLATTGEFTSASLIKTARKLDVLAASADPKLTSRLKAASQELTMTASRLKLLESQASGTASKFTFMGDVSAKAAVGMRTVSASAQGAMLSMALLEKNVIGVAFSLIFLQFSGALKLSLAFAVLSAAGMLAFKHIQKILKTRKEAKELASSFFIIAGSSQAMALATARSEKITEGFKLEGDKAEEMTKGLTQAQLALRQRGIEPTAEQLQVFASAFAITRVQGESFEKSLQTGLTSVIEYSKGSVASVGELQLGFDGLIKSGQFAISGLAGIAKEEGFRLGSAIRALADNTNVVEAQFFRGLLKLSGEVVDVNDETARKVKARLEEEGIDVKQFIITVETAETDFKTAFSGMSSSAEENLGARGAAIRAVETFEGTLGALAAQGTLTERAIIGMIENIVAKFESTELDSLMRSTLATIARPFRGSLKGPFAPHPEEIIPHSQVGVPLQMGSLGNGNGSKTLTANIVINAPGGDPKAIGIAVREELLTADAILDSMSRGHAIGDVGMFN